MRMLRFDGLAKAIVVGWTILVSAGVTNALPNARFDDDDGKKSPTPPGLYVTPTALPNAVQQDLNPGLGLPYFAMNYPKFVAGEAV